MNQNFIANAIQGVMPDCSGNLGLFISTITFQEPTGYTSTGEPSGNYTDIAGLVNLKCMDAPENVTFKIAANESHNDPEIVSDAPRHVLLDRYYAVLSPATDWGDVETGEPSWTASSTDVQGVENDSQLQMNRVCLHKVSTVRITGSATFTPNNSGLLAQSLCGGA